MSVQYKIPVSMLRDHAIVLLDGTEIRLQDLVEGYIDVVNSIGSANNIHGETGSPMELCELWYGIMSRLNKYGG